MQLFHKGKWVFWTLSLNKPSQALELSVGDAARTGKGSRIFPFFPSKQRKKYIYICNSCVLSPTITFLHAGKEIGHKMPIKITVVLMLDSPCTLLCTSPFTFHHTLQMWARLEQEQKLHWDQELIMQFSYLLCCLGFLPKLWPGGFNLADIALARKWNLLSILWSSLPSIRLLWKRERRKLRWFVCVF